MYRSLWFRAKSSVFYLCSHLNFSGFCSKVSMFPNMQLRESARCSSSLRISAQPPVRDQHGRCLLFGRTLHWEVRKLYLWRWWWSFYRGLFFIGDVPAFDRRRHNILHFMLFLANRQRSSEWWIWYNSAMLKTDTFGLALAFDEIWPGHVEKKC